MQSRLDIIQFLVCQWIFRTKRRNNTFFYKELNATFRDKQIEPKRFAHPRPHLQNPCIVRNHILANNVPEKRILLPQAFIRVNLLPDMIEA